MPATDAYTVRVTALFDALAMLGPQDITGLEPGALDLSQNDVLVALENATDQLTTAAYIHLGTSLAASDMPRNFRETAESWVPRRLVRLTITATRWTQALMHSLGGILITDTLADAVVAAATYHLALQDMNHTMADLGGVAATILNKANSTHA